MSAIAAAGAVTATPPPQRVRPAAAVDLKNLPHSRRHPVVFERLEVLGDDEALVVSCDYEPQLLRWHVEARWPGRFAWSWEQTGPLVWRARVERIA